MSDEREEEIEIDFMELIGFCWKRKWQFIIPMAIAAVLLVAFCIISIKMDPEKSPLPNKYTSTAKLLVRETSSTAGISSSLSSLASLGGISLGGAVSSSNGTLITTISETNAFKDDIIREFDLINKNKIEQNIKTNARKALSGALSIEFNNKTSVLSVSYTNINPVFAQQVCTYAVKLLMEQFYAVSEDDDSINLKNYQEAMDASFQKIVQYQKDIQNLEQSVSISSATSVPSIMFDVQMKKLELEAEETIYANIRSQHELLQIQMQNKPTTIKILQDAEVPDMKSGPSRATICIIGELIVFVFCLIFVVLRFYNSQKTKKETATKEIL